MKLPIPDRAVERIIPFCHRRDFDRDGEMTPEEKRERQDAAQRALEIAAPDLYEAWKRDLEAVADQAVARPGTVPVPTWLIGHLIALVGRDAIPSSVTAKRGSDPVGVERVIAELRRWLHDGVGPGSDGSEAR